jgi:hypothetical protein
MKNLLNMCNFLRFSVALIMPYYWINPLADSRWSEFIDHHAYSSVFHTPGWLRALHRTYGFTPTVLTTSPPGTALADGIPFCRIRSPITGSRLVSLPFTDHCQPLSAPESLLELLPDICDHERLKYVQLRPLVPPPLPRFSSSERYYFHLLDLRPPMEEIFGRFHRDCIRRKIRRAERESLVCEAGRSNSLLDEFFNLQVTTRRRHGLPPQPRQWFRNLLDAMEETATIRVARFRGRAIASILMLRHKQTEVYKYGCSEAEDNRRGGMQLILWQAIEEAKRKGMQWMDLGRCDIEDEGLAVFKERWGAERKELVYFSYPQRSQRKVPLRFFARLPRPVLIAAGRLLYRHMA